MFYRDKLLRVAPLCTREQQAIRIIERPSRDLHLPAHVEDVYTLPHDVKNVNILYHYYLQAQEV